MTSNRQSFSATPKMEILNTIYYILVCKATDAYIYMGWTLDMCNGIKYEDIYGSIKSTFSLKIAVDGRCIVGV